MTWDDWIPVVLAAGRSERMGAPKLALRHGGASVLARTIGAVQRLTGRTPLVVTPAGGPVWAEAAAAGVVAALNPAPERGLAGSLAIGAQAGGRRGLLVFLGDQPLVSARAVAAVLAEAERWPTAELVAPQFRGGVPGHPVYVARRLLAGVGQLEGDRGARALARNLPPELACCVAVDEPAPPDLDTPADWAQFQQQHGEPHAPGAGANI